MKQIEATKERPFYSVCYQYIRNPWALFSCNRFGKEKETGRTMQGTDSLQLAKDTADRLVKEKGIHHAIVSVTLDCYNHQTVYTAFAEIDKS